MKTSTITFHWAKSFGAVLQAYSLQQFLIENGYENEIIDYSGNRNGSFRLYKKSNSLKGILSNIDTLFHKKEIVCGNKRFIEFINNQLRLTKSYNSSEELENNPPKADAYITGSDQVWSIGRGIGDSYFLNFGQDSTKRISYAASMGKSVVPTQYIEEVKKYLDKFSAISVREHAVKAELSKIIDSNIEENIDPTFLTPAENWRKLEHEVDKVKKPYILCYCIYRPQWLNVELKKLHEATGKDIVIIEPSSFRNVYYNKQIRDAGPEEFLWLIDNADAVVTTSFHGVAFSMIFHKPLYAIVNPDSPERIMNLLTLLGTQNSIVNKLESIPPTYDEKMLDIRIREQQKKSRNYINKAFKE